MVVALEGLEQERQRRLAQELITPSLLARVFLDQPQYHQTVLMVIYLLLLVGQVLHLLHLLA
ncbi:MAG: hypothetical protein EB072_21480 [Betaproteobacteria bacterium]|nr:hypothetical protein [Betaproteobacteria bacterium]